MPGAYRLVIKDHAGDQLGVLDRYESFTYQKRISDVGVGVLAANYGVTDATDAKLDYLDIDIILEVQRHADPTDPDQDWYVDWMGFCQTPKEMVTKVATRRKEWLFVHVNHLLKRRVIIPPDGRFVITMGSQPAATRWLVTGIPENLIRDLVRYQSVDPKDPNRIIPGLYVQDNATPAAGAGDPGIVFPPTPDPEVWGVLCTYEWLGDLYLGGYYGGANDVWYSADGESWTDGNLSTTVWDLVAWDDGGGERLYAATGSHTFQANSRVYRSNVGAPAGWASYSMALQYRGNSMLSLCVHGNRLYASSGSSYFKLAGPTYYCSGHINRCDVGDGTTWNGCFDGNIGGTGSKFEKYKGIEALHSWGGYLYAGACYLESQAAGGNHVARILRSASGDPGSWAVVHEVAGMASWWRGAGAARWNVSQSELDGFCCFAEFGSYLYAGIGSRFNPISNQGQIWRTNDGTTWKQVFGIGMPLSADADVRKTQLTYRSHGITSLGLYGGLLYAGSGGYTKGDGQVWYSEDGETWNLAFDGNNQGFFKCDTLIQFGADLYAGFGWVPHQTDQREFTYGGSAGATEWMYEDGDSEGALWRRTDDGWLSPEASEGGSGRWPNLFDIIQRIQERTFDEDGGIDFGVEPTDLGGETQEFMFRVASPWGTDHRNTGADPTIFGIARGNMADFEYTEERKDRPTVIYALGSDQQEERIVYEIPNIEEMRRSPWGRYEAAVDVQESETAAELYVQAKGTLELTGPVRNFYFKTLQTPSTRYGVEWDVGDLATCVHEGVTYHIKFTGATVSLGANPAVEDIEPEMKLLEVA